MADVRMYAYASVYLSGKHPRRPPNNERINLIRVHAYSLSSPGSFIREY